jgi:hypothetical protein
MRWTRNSLLLSLCAILALAAFGCSNDSPSPVATTGVSASGVSEQSLSVEEALMQLMTLTNAQLETSGAGYRVHVAEWFGLGYPGSDMRVVFFSNVGNKQLAHHFVPADPRRAWGTGGTSINYCIDSTEGATTSGLTTPQTTAAIDRAMDTWQNVTCATIPLVRLADHPVDVGVVQFINGLGGSPIVAADITHAGWFPAGILNPNTIAVTFTFIFIDGNGNPTDIDSNRKLDTAFREIYYNDAFDWQIDPGCQLCPPIDVETVALHEVGHGLSQGHFGKAFLDAAGKPGLSGLHFSPTAVMMAGYAGEKQDLTGSDEGGHCSIWAQWPNN